MVSSERYSILRRVKVLRLYNMPDKQPSQPHDILSYNRGYKNDLSLHILPVIMHTYLLLQKKMKDIITPAINP